MNVHKKPDSAKSNSTPTREIRSAVIQDLVQAQRIWWNTAWSPRAVKYLFLAGKYTDIDQYSPVYFFLNRQEQFVNAKKQDVMYKWADADHNCTRSCVHNERLHSLSILDTDIWTVIVLKYILQIFSDPEDR